MSLAECKECIARTICGGGCAFDSFVLYKDISHVDKRNCQYIKDILEFMIWDLFELLDNKLEEVIIPTMEERKKMYNGTTLSSLTLSESVGHKIY